MKHRLLNRQIKKFLSPDIHESGGMNAFLQAVDSAYQNYDADYRQVERMLEISAKESFKELSDFRNAISATSMVVISDFHGMIVYVNDNYSQASGFRKSELMGKPIRLFDSDFQTKAFYVEMRQTITSGKIWKGEMKEKSKNGEYYWVDATVVPLLNSKGKPIKYISFKVDISRIKNSEESYLKAKEEAERALEIKAEFLSNMSHEIRTPMNAIIGLTDIVLLEDLDLKVRDNLKLVTQSASNLLVIINDILDFSKIEAGKIDIEDISFDFNYQIQHVFKLMNLKSELKNLSFYIDIDKNIPRFLIGDPVRLNQILLNLIGNSIKFTLKGSVKLVVKLLEEKNNRALIKFAIQDTGVGISKERQAHIFDSFIQADIEVTRRFGGTGLGLTITKKLLHLMGSDIYVESSIGKGSNFYFELVFQITDEEEIRAQSQNLKEKSIEGLNILVMEDNLINQKVITQFLSKWGCEVTVAINGEYGLQEMNNQKFDIVLMDLQMPVMDGYKATKEIRKGKAGLDHIRIPIIALTADAFPETKDRVINCGMNDLVSKPFKSAILNRAIFCAAKLHCPENLMALDVYARQAGKEHGCHRLNR